MAVPHPDPVPDSGSGALGSGGLGSSPVLGSGPVDLAFAQIVWQATRPGWTQAGWWDAEVRPEVRDLLWLPVGLELQQRLMASAANDRVGGYEAGECPFPHSTPTVGEQLGVPGHPCACQIATIAAWTAVASWVALQSDQAVVAVAGAEPVEEYLVPDRPDLGTITDPAIEELAPALRVSQGSARYRLAGLRRIAALPRLREAVETGVVIGWHAQALSTDLRHLPDTDQVTVIDRLLDRLADRRAQGLREWTSTDLRCQAKRIAARLNLDLAARRRDCHKRRGIRLHLRGHGAATISADLADDVATRIFNRITAIAHGLDADCDDTGDGGEGLRTLEQRRADVFTDLLLGSPHHTSPSARGDGDAGNHRAADGTAPGFATRDTGAGLASSTVTGSEVAVVIDVATLLQLAEDPAELPGLGPIPVDIARDLAADSRWRAWITQSTTAGTQVIATSPGTYRPSAALARLIRAREPECRLPGCRSRISDLDHVIPFRHGQTTEANLGPLCRRHHRMKTHTRWRQQTRTNTGDDSASSDENAVTMPGIAAPSTTWTWTSPAGITHDDHPDPPLP